MTVITRKLPETLRLCGARKAERSPKYKHTAISNSQKKTAHAAPKRRSLSRLVRFQRAGVVSP
jgi:hypothetical protein